jgi:hypothetical protein
MTNLPGPLLSLSSALAPLEPRLTTPFDGPSAFLGQFHQEP